MKSKSVEGFFKSTFFKISSLVITVGTSSGLFIYFLMSNQISYLKSQKEDIEKRYELNNEIAQKKCDNEKIELRNSIEVSILSQYKKFDKKSKESELFFETLQLLQKQDQK